MFHKWFQHRHDPAWAWQGAHEPGAEHGHRHGDDGHRGHSPFGWTLHGMSRRFPFGPGGFGKSGESPFFGRGDLKYGLLELLLERPKHGYEMIKELEDKAGGFYTPSAGAVYPALQMMEDREWVTNQTIEGKKVYSITEAGKQALKEHQQDKEHLRRPPDFGGFGRGFGKGKGFFRHGGSPEVRELHHQMMEVTRMLWTAVISTEGDLSKLGQLRKIIDNTRQQLTKFMEASSASEGEDIV